MPTLPEREERPSLPERTAGALRRAGAAIGADARVPLRLMIFLLVSVLAMSTAPTPWVQVGVVALLGIALDIARMRRVP